MQQPETAGTVEVAGKSYMVDAKGSLVPLELVKPADKLMDETVRKVMDFSRELSAQIARFKGHTFDDLASLQSLLEQEYGARAGGAKGNVSFVSFDGTMKVQVQIADKLDFGPELGNTVGWTRTHRGTGPASLARP